MFNPADTGIAARGIAEAGRRRFPARRPGTAYFVEAGGQQIRGFRRGLDYAFIRTLL